MKYLQTRLEIIFKTTFGLKCFSIWMVRLDWTCFRFFCSFFPKSM